MPSQPKPITGNRRPNPDDQASFDRADEAAIRFKEIWVEHGPQTMINKRIRRYINTERLKRGPRTGRRLSQYSQAGKSATIERLIKELIEEDQAAGREPNKYRILHVTIDADETVKQLFHKILKLMDDELLGIEDGRKLSVERQLAKDQENRRVGRMSTQILENRIADWIVRLGVELIVVDEIQRLGRSADGTKVSEKFQGFLDRGLVCMVFVGDETSERFLVGNKQLAPRLLEPLELKPLRTKPAYEAQMFKSFCASFDEQLQSSGATALPNGLTEASTLSALHAASGGHVGRVARLLEVALPAAMERGAARIEPFDLSNAVRNVAIPAGWVDNDPFEVA